MSKIQRKHGVINVVRLLDQEISNRTINEKKRALIAVAKQNLEAAYKLEQNDFQSTLYVDLHKQFKKAQKMEARLYGERVASDFKAKGRKAFSEKKFDLSLLSFSTALRYNSKNPAYWCDRAEAYHNMGALEKAMDDCKQALRLKPRCARAHNRMGLLYFNMNYKMSGLNSIRKAVLCEPTHLAYRVNFRILRNLAVADKDAVNPEFMHDFNDETITALIAAGGDTDLDPFANYSFRDLDKGEDLDDGDDIDPQEPRVFNV